MFLGGRPRKKESIAGALPDHPDAVICCIARDEELYIEEWITYHLKLGFNRVYVYDNNLDKPLLIEKPRVTIIPFPGAHQQLPAYRHFHKYYGTLHTWCAFIDVDEFIVLRKHPTITDFLRDHCKSGAVNLNWFHYGSSGHLVYEDKPVLERFQLRSKTMNPHTKTIVRLEHMETMDSPHYVQLKQGFFQRDPRGRIFYGPFNDGKDDIACINHYFVKSMEEFLRKVDRGRASQGGKYDPKKDFQRFDLNQVLDRSALDFDRKKN